MTRRRRKAPTFVTPPAAPSARRPGRPVPLRLDLLEGREVPAAGALDLTFGADGILTIPIGAGHDNGAAVTVQPDGKVVVAATTVRGDTTDFAVLRRHADGSPDLSFGVGGAAVADILPFDTAYALALQPDGKIVVAGWGSATVSQDDTDIVLARFNPDGSLDLSFGTAGRVSTDFGPGSQLAAAVVVQPDGRIVVTGSTRRPAGLSDFALVRYTADGALDPTFGTGGRVTTDFGFGSDSAAGLGLQPDGKIVAAGQAFDGRTTRAALARYLPDGSLDPTFGHGGTVTTPVGGGPTGLNGMAVLPDGRIVAGGRTYGAVGNPAFLVARYLPDGTLDPTFGGGRPVTTAVAGTGGLGTGFAVQQDGKVILTGSCPVLGSLDFAAVRYNPDGSLDPTFGQGGTVTTDVLPRSNDFAAGAAVQADGRILVVGYEFYGGPGANADVALVRYRPDGSLDRLSDGTGIVTTPVGPGDDVAAGLAVQADGKVVVAGRSFNGTNDDMAVVRYNRDGSLDRTFGGTGAIRYDLCGDADAAGPVAVRADGRIMVAGVTWYIGHNEFAVLRLDPDGSRDPAFGGGVVHRWYADDGAVNALVVQPDGKVLVAGWGQAFSGTDDDFILVRLDRTGADDPTFHGGRAVFTPVGTGDDSILGLALQADGKIVAVGRARNGSADDIALVRYNPDGSLDPTFGSGGKVLTDFGGDEMGSAVAIQADGKIVVAGRADGAFVAVRYNPDGTVDGSFGQAGRVTADFGVADAGATGVVVQADGKVVATGSAGGQFALARFNSDGSPDGAFAVSGQELIPVGVGSARAAGMAVGPDGKVVVAGTADNGSNDDFAVVRVRGDNRAPVPVPTTLALDEDTPLVVTSPAYFYDPDGDVATTELLYAPAHGTLDLTPYGTFTYTPAPDYNGTDRFAYKVADASGGFNVGSVDLVVTPVPEAVEVRADPAVPGKTSLFVRGTDGDDTIVVKPVGTSRTTYVVTRNGGPAETVTGVTGRVYVDGLGGNDSIQVRAVRAAAVLDGGPGDDSLTGGPGNDSLTGGPGDDVLDGGPGTDRVVEAGNVDFFLASGPAGGNGTLAGGLGADVLVRNRIEEAELTGGASDNRLDASRFRGRTWLRGMGGNDYLLGGASADVILGGDGADFLDGGMGRDVLIGGLGQDVIGGDQGSDLVIGGVTLYDGRPAALAAVQAEWLSGSAYATRVKHLRGTLAGGKNGDYRLDPTTVFDEEGTGLALNGGTGLDWFITHPGDATDRVDPEQVLTV